MENNRDFRERGTLQRLWLVIERLVNGFTTSAYNPFYYLGAITIFFLWIILVTGIYLFLFYDISARGAYLSVQSLTINQWYLGGIMRSMHRYASDALVIAMILHAARCWFLDRYKFWRWLPWVSGVAIAWIIWIGGIFGYWMVWDETAKLVATLSAHLLENIPIFGLPLSLNFVRIESLTDQLFYIVLFMHFSSIFFVFILVLIHIMRITKSIINPPRIIAYGIVFLLLLFSLLKPALSGPPAALKALSGPVPFDWLYLFVFPLLNFASAHAVWVFIIAATLIVAAVPWLTRERRKPPVEITLENCTGCELCVEDCPYQALMMRPRTDKMPYPLEAVVIPNRCASCGICVGACDYKALNLPDLTEDAVKKEVKRLSEELARSEGKKVFVFSCAKGAWLDKAGPDGRLKGYDWARVVKLPCIGMLQPSMLSIPFEAGVDGVYVSSCRHGDCDYRRGDEWLAGRLAGYRPPVVKRAVDRTRVRVGLLSAAEGSKILTDLESFKEALKPRS